MKKLVYITVGTLSYAHRKQQGENRAGRLNRCEILATCSAGASTWGNLR